MATGDSASMAQEPSFDEFVRSASSDLVGVLTVAVGDRWVAEDLAQEAFARAWRQWSSVQAMDSPTAWVRRVAFNLSASRWRRRAASRRASSRHGPVSDRADLPDAAEAVAVRAAIVTLPPKQRAVVACRFYLGLDIAETAEAVGCAPGTVKAHTHQAVKALRAAGLGPEHESKEQVADG